MARSNGSIEICPVSPAVGAEIRGVDLSEDLDEQTFSLVKQAFTDHGVIFFRDQTLTPEQHAAFAERAASGGGKCRSECHEIDRIW